MDLFLSKQYLKRSWVFYLIYNKPSINKAITLSNIICDSKVHILDMAFSRQLPVFIAVCLGLCLSFQYTAKLEGIRDFFLDTVEIILERAKGDPPKSNRTLVDLAGFLNILVKQVDRIILNPAFHPAPEDEALLKSVVFEMDCEFDRIALNDSKLTHVFKLSHDQIEQYKKIMMNTGAVIRNITDLINAS